MSDREESPGPQSRRGIERVRRAREESSTAGGIVHCYLRSATGLHAVPASELVSRFKEARSASSDAPTLWVDIIRPGVDQETLLKEGLELHELAVEDIMRGRQRPKVDRYSGYVFLVLYAASINSERRRSALEELHVFIGRGWIVTVHDHRSKEVGDVIARWRIDEEAYATTGALAHALLDAVIDSFMPVIDFIGGEVDEIEHRVLVAPTDTGMSALLELRKEVATTRRVLAPLHDLIHDLIRRDAILVDPALQPFFMDVLDHVKREVEELDALRDTLAAALGAYLSVSSNQLNQTVRVMAGWSIILMAMAWIAGIYGMNYTAMPELRWTYGYLWAIGLMVAVGTGLFIYFRRRRWL
jgi:magnesium transporter